MSGIREFKFFGLTVKEHRICTNREQIEKFLQTIRTPKTIKQVKLLIGFIQYFNIFSKFSIYVNEFLSLYCAFKSFEHYVWGVNDKPVLVLSDNKSVLRLFQAKHLLGSLWKSLVYV